MPADPPLSLQVPMQARHHAEQSLEQAKKAVDGFLAAANKTIDKLQDNATAAQLAANDISQKTINFAESNMASSFEFAQKLVRAKDVQEVLALQQEFLRTQMQKMSEQASKLGNPSTAHLAPPRNSPSSLPKAESFKSDEYDVRERIGRITTEANRVFGDHAFANKWLTLPNPALRDRIPIELAQTDAGAREVDSILSRIAHGDYT